MITKTILTAIAAFAAMAVSASAIAAPSSTDPDTVSVKISLSGIDLQSPAGARVALVRIHQAARHICGDEPDGRDMQSRALFQVCEKSTADRAVKSLASPLVTALNGDALGTVAVASRSN